MPRATLSRSGAAVVLVIALLSFAAHADVQVPTGFVDERIASGIDTPTSLVFLPDGRALVTEQKTGRVRLIVGGHLSTSYPLAATPDLNPDGYERGLQGIAVDPGWPQRPWVYLSHNRLDNRIRLVRYTAHGALTDSTSENLTLDSPYIVLERMPDNDSQHNSGCLRFGRNFDLFMSLGDDRDPCSAQDPTSLKGEVLRLDLTRLPAGGEGPPPLALITPRDNPLSTADSNAKLVWAYGLRNPWRFHVDPHTQLLYLSDVGEDTWEELDEVHPGDNLGWPFREGPMVATLSGCQEPLGPGRSTYVPPIAAYHRPPGMTAMISAGIYRSVSGAASNWPSDYEGNVFYGEYYTGWINRLVRDASGAWVAAPMVDGQPDTTHWATGLESVVDFEIGHDGSLYWITQYEGAVQSGSLHRIRSTNPAPPPPPPPPPPPQSAGGDSTTLEESPNPFVHVLQLSFRVAVSGRTVVDIFDLAGRRVRTLFDGISDGTPMTIGWNGDDASGYSLPVGVYLVRLRDAGGATRTCRVLHLK